MKEPLFYTAISAIVKFLEQSDRSIDQPEAEALTETQGTGKDVDENGSYS